ncbi:hypothetical protein HDU89_000981 [Geranomyces variabilis]|nr:hypothetical protein HDU89_000981 [Geranomyces variabilis]
MADVRRLLKQQRAARASVTPSSTPAAAKRAVRAAALGKPATVSAQREPPRKNAPEFTKPPSNAEKAPVKRRSHASVPLVAYAGGSDNNDNSDGEGASIETQDIVPPVAKRPKTTDESRTDPGSDVATAAPAENGDGDKDAPAGLPAGFFDAPKKIPEPAWKTEAQLAAEYARFEAELAVEEAAGAAGMDDEDEDLEERRQRDLAVESAEQKTLEQRVEALRQARSRVALTAHKEKASSAARATPLVTSTGSAPSLQKAFEDEDIEYSYEDDDDEEEEEEDRGQEIWS